MGENGSGIIMSNGLLYMKRDDSEEYEPIIAFNDIKTIEEEDKEASSDNIIAMDIPHEYGFTIEEAFRPRALRRYKKLWSGFGNCKGPGRYKSIEKCLKYMRKAYRVDGKYLRMFVELGYIPVNEELSCPVVLYGLPCTDIWEYLWYRMSVAENSTEYIDYRCEKIKRTIHSKHRQRR